MPPRVDLPDIERVYVLNLSTRQMLTSIYRTASLLCLAERTSAFGCSGPIPAHGEQGRSVQERLSRLAVTLLSRFQLLRWITRRGLIFSIGDSSGAGPAAWHGLLGVSVLTAVQMVLNKFRSATSASICRTPASFNCSLYLWVTDTVSRQIFPKRQ